MHTRLKEQILKNGKKQNYMTVPAAIREQEKIDMIQLPNSEYRLNYVVTATQKEILKSFNMIASNKHQN